MNGARNVNCQQRKIPFFMVLNEARCWIVNDGATGAKNHHHHDENVYDVEMNLLSPFLHLTIPFGGRWK